jgi:hypothetical protein
MHRAARPRSAEQVRVVELGLVDEEVAVRIRRDGEVALADVLTECRPGHASKMEQRDSAVAEVVRAEHGDTGGSAGAADRRSQPVRSHVFEHAPVRMAIVARTKIDHGGEEDQRSRHRPRRSMKIAADEQSFQTCVLEVARLAGWRGAHFRPARTKQGWRTPVTADGAGWPDLVLVRPPRLVFAELKSAHGKATSRQLEWLDVLRLLPGVETYLWRPRLGQSRRDAHRLKEGRMTRPTAAELLETRGALLSRTHLRELGLERRAVDAVFRACPVVALPGYSRPLIRAEDYRAFLAAHTYRGDRVRP